MSAKSSSSGSSFVQPKYRRYDLDAEPYIDTDSYMDIGGAADAGYTPLLEKDYVCTTSTNTFLYRLTITTPSAQTSPVVV